MRKDPAAPRRPTAPHGAPRPPTTRHARAAAPEALADLQTLGWRRKGEGEGEGKEEEDEGGAPAAL